MMKSERFFRGGNVLRLVNAHCEGEVGRVVVEGVPSQLGRTPSEVMHHLNNVDDSWRRACVLEPRGNAAQSTNLLLPASVSEAMAGFVVLQPDRIHAMSGSNAICVVTVMLETGLIEQVEPKTTVILETPAGLVSAEASCRAGKCEQVSLSMTPAFAERLDIAMFVPGVGQVSCDLAFGGVYYLLVDADQLGLPIEPGNARGLVRAGNKILSHAKAEVRPNHPTEPALNEISYVMFCGTNAEGELLGATIMSPGRLDRSPCGTGNAARLAVRHARGQARVGETAIARSVTDGRLEVKFADELSLAGRIAVQARITGRAWLYGQEEIWIDPTDPHPLGHCLPDVWGGMTDDS